MKNVSLFASAAAIASVALAASPAFAQGGPFADVPADHWAYASVEKLQREGIVIGYPDQTYGGKRAMTRYEFAVAIARLLDKLNVNPTPGNVDLSNYYNKAEVDSRLAGLVTKEEAEQLRALINEFKNELSTLGVDVDAIKKRLDSLEGRVSAIEKELKRVRITGAMNVMARGNNRFSSGNTGAMRDRDGYVVTQGIGSRGGVHDDSRVFHDIDLGIKARINDKTTAEAVINFGNYMSFLNSISSFSGARSDRAAVAGEPFPQRASQDQVTSIYKLAIDTTVKLPLLKNTAVSVGRIPVQFTPYTLKLIDVDSYFTNDKTDNGDIPVDGGKASFSFGSLGFTVLGAKVDPIQFVSDANKISQTFNQTNGQYGLFAGAARSAYGGTNAANGGLRASNGRPVQNSVSNARNGAMPVEQMLGARGAWGSKFGTLGATFLTLGGSSPVRPNPQPLATDPDFARLQGSRGDFETVRVYGADFATQFSGIGIQGSYTESETYGRKINRDGFGQVSSVDSELARRTGDDNFAWDASAAFKLFGIGLVGGYRYVGPYFGAPGYWTRMGSLVNPTDIKGPYAKFNLPIGKLALNGEAQFYEGTGDAVNEGGLTEDDMFQNYKASLMVPFSKNSALDLGAEYTQYKVINAAGGRDRPYELFYNIGYGYAFSPNSTIKFLYQIADYNDKNSGFDPGIAKGGVATAQFSVKF